MPWLALPCHAQDVAYTKLFKPCLASPLPCVALACRGHGLDMPCQTRAFVFRCLGMPCPCPRHAVPNSCLCLPLPWHALPFIPSASACIALPFTPSAFSCVALPFTPSAFSCVGMPCLTLPFLCSHSRHSDKVTCLRELTMSWLRSASDKNDDKIFRNLSCHALRAQPAQSMRAQIFPKLVLPCLARSMRTASTQRAHILRAACAQLAHSIRAARLFETCLGIPCAQRAYTMRASFAQLARSVRNVERAAFAKLVLPRRARSLRAACRQHARSSFSNVDRIFQTLSNPIFIDISSHNKKTIRIL